MTVHICRDLLTINTAIRTPIYPLALFMRRVLKYSYVGSTALKIQTTGESGANLMATGDTAPATQNGTWSGADKASINLGSGLEYKVAIPIGVYTVQAGDLNRLLVLRSTANPKFNSGVFRITNVDTVNNRYTIDYRSSDFPPAEVTALEWYLYKSDADLAFATTSGANPYTGWGVAAACSRIILQSPHAAAWQVRICGEPTAELSGSRTTAITMAPGFDGDGDGDFAPLGSHTHMALWGNTATTAYCTAAGELVEQTGTLRLTMIGDDTGQAVALVIKPGTATQYGIVLFGIPDNEPVAMPDKQRIFVIGVQYGFNRPNNQFFWYTDNSDAVNRHSAGTALGLGSTPIGASWSAWCYASGNSAQAHPGADSTASDSVWSLSTELLPVDVVAGFWLGSWYNTSGGVNVPMPLEPRVMGTAPYVRQGRTNFGDYMLTTSNSWFHLKNGMYLQWGGPSIIP